MRVFVALLRRELGGHFKSLTGYVVIAAILLLLGFSLLDVIEQINGDATVVPVTELYYRSFYFWLIVLLTSPVITMRTFAAEKSAGTYESLMTTPVGDWQVVFAKYAGSLTFFLLAWIPSFLMLFVLRYLTKESVLFHPGTIAATFLGIALIGSLFMAMGCFASSITRSQIVASMVSMLMGIGLWIVGYQASVVSSESQFTPFLQQISMIRHLTDFSRGIVDTAHVAFYLGATLWFLFLTHRVVESRHWK